MDEISFLFCFFVSVINIICKNIKTWFDGNVHVSIFILNVFFVSKFVVFLPFPCTELYTNNTCHREISKYR